MQNSAKQTWYNFVFAITEFSLIITMLYSLELLTVSLSKQQKELYKKL
jgi:hypothetical protein